MQVEKVLLFFLNCKYDIYSCLSQSDYLNTGVLSVKTELIKVYESTMQIDHNIYFLSNHVN